MLSLAVRAAGCELRAECGLNPEEPRARNLDTGEVGLAAHRVYSCNGRGRGASLAIERLVIPSSLEISNSEEELGQDSTSYFVPTPFGASKSCRSSKPQLSTVQHNYREP